MHAEILDADIEQLQAAASSCGKRMRAEQRVARIRGGSQLGEQDQRAIEWSRGGYRLDGKAKEDRYMK
jgi:hypothetical protein